MNSNDCYFRDGDIVRIKLKGIRMTKKESRWMRILVNKIDEKRDNKLEITGLDNLIRLMRKLKTSFNTIT